MKFLKLYCLSVEFFVSLFLTVVMLLLWRVSPYSIQKFSNHIDQQKALGTLKCLGEACYRLSSYTGDLEHLENQSTHLFERGQELIVLDKNTEILLSFDDGSQKIIRTEGSVVAQQGAKNFSLDEYQMSFFSNPNSNDANPLDHGRLLFVGDLEVEVLSPVPGAVLLVQKFPHTFPFSLRTKIHEEDRLNLYRLQKWNLVRIHKTASDSSNFKIARVASVDMKILESENTSEKTILARLYEQFELHEAGTYALVPEDKALVEDELRMRFEIKLAQKNFKESLRDTLRGLQEKSGQGSIVIEQ